MTDFTPFTADKARTQSRHRREQQAKAFFEKAFPQMNQAIENGFLRWQFRQKALVSYHDTQAGQAFARMLTDMGFSVGWAYRAIDPKERGNVFGQAVHIRELRVWWHDGEEKLGTGDAAQPAEGSIAQDRLPEKALTAMVKAHHPETQEQRLSPEEMDRLRQAQEAWHKERQAHQRKLARKSRTWAQFMTGTPTS